jgi:hypothetical protein
MPRKNHNPHPSHMSDRIDRYDVDYIFLPDAPELAAVVVPQMKTVYRNMCCAPWADTMHEVKSEKDKYLAMIRRMY